MIEPPLLMLAEGRRPRLRRAPRLPADKESKLHVQVANTLFDHALPDWRWSHFPAGEKRNKITGARLKRMGLRRGWPDFQLVSPAGVYHGLELKRLGEPLTDDQEEFQLWCIQRGVPHAVAYTLDQAHIALDSWGCLRIKFGERL